MRVNMDEHPAFYNTQGVLESHPLWPLINRHIDREDFCESRDFVFGKQYRFNGKSYEVHTLFL